MPVYVAKDKEQDLCNTCAQEYSKCSPWVVICTEGSTRVPKCDGYVYLGEDSTVVVQVERSGKPIIEPNTTHPDQLKTDKPIGMYGETPELRVGPYMLRRQDPSGVDNSVWIEHDNGEGGTFPDSLIASILDDVYNKKL